MTTLRVSVNHTPPAAAHPPIEMSSLDTNGPTACPAHADIIMIAFITAILGKCGAGPVRRRSWLGVAGIMIIVFAGVAAYGLNSGFGEIKCGHCLGKPQPERKPPLGQLVGLLTNRISLAGCDGGLLFLYRCRGISITNFSCWVSRVLSRNFECQALGCTTTIGYN